MGSYFVRKADLALVKSIDYCVYCGSNVNLVIDHIYPQIKGGKSNIENLTRACNKCNLYKSDFTIDIFLNRLIEKREKSRQIIISCINIIYKSKKRKTPIISRFSNVFKKLDEERSKHSYYSLVIGNIIRKKYKLF